MRNYRIIRYFCYISMSISLALLFGCNEEQRNVSSAGKINSENLIVSEETRQSLQAIKNYRILFAHHSVGQNIINGIKELAKESGVNLKIDSMNESSLTINNKFVDFSPGENAKPKTKIDGFVSVVENLDSEYVPDIAFMKFCYIDFLQETDIKDVFDHYKKNIMMLKKNRPGITFVHFTAPLMARSYDIKARIKGLLGKEHWIDVTNVKRAKFNDLILKTYPKDLIFDIARIESTRRDGSRVEFLADDKVYYSLASEYTDDGSHLNRLGRRVAASEMATFLANVLSKNNKIN